MDFSAEAIISLGWRQGAVLRPSLHMQARACAPAQIQDTENEKLIVVSHDCDIANASLDKEPVFEVLRAVVIPVERKNKLSFNGRNPRKLQLEFIVGSENQLIEISIHDRWWVPRELLAQEAPAAFLDDKSRKCISEWIAKRYIRAAFPTAFNERFQTGGKAWIKLLATHSDAISGIYLLLSTESELAVDVPYKCELIIASTPAGHDAATWLALKRTIEQAFYDFWRPLKPGIVCQGVEFRRQDDITLADLAQYLRFDADWLSFSDDTPATPILPS